nr:helix-turn-helix transcriptional regulator [uncultured Schaedlerella sp.]
MFEMDKTAFGKFLTEQRKSKGYTQKILAEKLYVSDKAVSKWERGLSMPDISLLIPLSAILEVSVTELLEGRKLNRPSEMDADHVELLVKKVLSFSEDTLASKKDGKKHALLFGGSTAVTVLELLLVFRFLPWNHWNIGLAVSLLGVFELLSLIFGIYAWFFIKETLPAYYDEYEVRGYNDGIFQLSLPGIRFNNRNWPHVVKCLRSWSVASMLIVPLPCALLLLFEHPMGYFSLLAGMLLLIAYLAGLFVPLYATAKKYESCRRFSQD